MDNIIIFSAPSGSGKTTIINKLLKKFPKLEFSVSATNRDPRDDESHGIHYYFLSQDEFNSKITNGEFLEWEEVYGGAMYGTLLSEIDRICKSGKVALFDLDVHGALKVKKKFTNAFLIFVLPPSIEDLKERLEKRSSETPEFLEKRLDKAKEEIMHATKFDYILLNDDVDEALVEIHDVIHDFLEHKLVPSTFRIVD
ncbi:MAG: guanylate kinase [Prevotellaceae bacterium]|jgi:guanylate kinase|nr:guanylate kinase [Prevotellaceae bacterium]